MPGLRDMEMAAAACFPQHARRIIDLAGNAFTVKERGAESVRIIAEEELADVRDRYIQMGDMPRKSA